IRDKKEAELKLKDGETNTVYFKVKAPENKESGSHTIEFSAKNSQFEDTVEISFPIKQNVTYEAVATANYTTNLTAHEYVWLPENVLRDKGGVEVKAAATLADTLPDALEYLVQYPYGCTEQLISKLSAVATVKRLSQVKNFGEKLKLASVEFEGRSYSADEVLEIGLARIMANQTYEGGFAYYSNMRPDYYLTLHVLNVLTQIKQAGYKIDDAAQTRAAKYIYQAFNNDFYLNSNKDTLILTAYALSGVAGARAEFDALMPRIRALENDAKFINEDISNLSLTYLALLLSHANFVAFQQKVFGILENRVVVDGRGAYLATNRDDYLWAYYETPIKDTALLIKAMALARREYPFTSNLIRFVKNSRFKDGAWGSTNNTQAVLDALVDYLTWKQEIESNFSL
ncbi:MAG: hypothetical protein AAB956_01920, partial [Patescibacteria group bacterium]